MKQRYGMLLSKLRSDSRGQDLIEYALMLGILAVAAGAVLPGVGSSISALFSQVGSVVKTADSAGDDGFQQQQSIAAPCEAGSQPAESFRPSRPCPSQP
jgi:Flp pilus assembly pilin Flp